MNHTQYLNEIHVGNTLVRMWQRVEWHAPAGIAGVTLIATVNGICAAYGGGYTVSVYVEPNEKLREVMTEARKFAPAADMSDTPTLFAYKPLLSPNGLDGNGGDILLTKDGLTSVIFTGNWNREHATVVGAT